MDKCCLHRRASLVLGRNEEGGLRCLDHGWKLDRKGSVLEMVAELEASGMASKIERKAYPVKERCGMVWAYMSPKETMPEFTLPAGAPTENTRLRIAEATLFCDRTQVLEGAVDSAHRSSLHLPDRAVAGMTVAAKRAANLEA